MAGEVPVTLGDVFPLKQEPPNSLSGRNTSTEWRRLLFDALFGTGPLLNGWHITRDGILPRHSVVVTAGVPQFRDMLVRPRTTPGQGVLIEPGIAAVYRGKQTGSVHEGFYVGGLLNTAQDLPLAAAPAGANRIDTVYFRLTDKNIVADASATTPHGGAFGYGQGATTAGALNFAGTPGTAGAPPVVPEGCVPLWDLPRMAGVNTVTQSVVDAGVDRRKSFGLRGGPRVLLPGDSPTEAGIVPGEITILPPTAARPQTIMRVWDGTVWRLAAPFTIPATPIIGSAGGLVGAPSTLATITVPDIGCPYRLRFATTVRLRMQLPASRCQQVIRIGTASGPVIRMGDAHKPEWATSTPEWPYFGGTHGVFPQPGVAALTGATQALWRLEDPSGDVVVWYEPTPGSDGAPGAHQYTVDVLPA